MNYGMSVFFLLLDLDYIGVSSLCKKPGLAVARTISGRGRKLAFAPPRAKK